MSVVGVLLVAFVLLIVAITALREFDSELADQLTVVGHPPVGAKPTIPTLPAPA